LLYGITLEQKYCMVMEYMVKGSLYDVLHSEQGKSLCWEQKYQIGLDIAKGLSYLHGQNILHRDLKSLNVLLDERYRAKLTDFGLSTVRVETSSASSNKTKQEVGTVPWMAPELFKRGAKYTEKSDVYSYGMVLWELCTRKVPFADAGGTPALIIQWIRSGEREEIPQGTPEAIEHVIQMCWKASAELRPTAAAIVKMLLKAMGAEESKIDIAEESEVDYQGNLASITSNSDCRVSSTIDSGYRLFSGATTTTSSLSSDNSWQSRSGLQYQ